MGSEVVVVMVPFVAQGHLNQLLHLSRLVSAHNVPIHFLASATHNRQACQRLHGWNPNNVVQFHDLPDYPTPLPHPTPHSPAHFPTHLQPSFNASLILRTPVADLIRSISQTSRKVVVVHDALMSYVVQDVKSIPNAETFIFRPLSVFYYFCFTCEKLPLEPERILRHLPTSGENVSPEFIDFIKLQYAHQTHHVGNLYDSSRIIEGQFLESLERDKLNGKNHWALGPFNPVEIRSEKSKRISLHACLQWLDKQPPSSVIYVSFGTTTTFTDDQITELAVGLEKSEQRFLWVLRNADGKEDSDVGPILPQGFEERVAGRGLVVREWAPQLEILGHVSTGGFVSHCGWNSCMEAMTAGVAIATWPMHTDQPYNVVLLAHVLRVAVVMREWVRRDELLTSAMVERVIRKLMHSPEGVAVRKKAMELGGELRRSVADGGVAHEELKSFISYIRR